MRTPPHPTPLHPTSPSPCRRWRESRQLTTQAQAAATAGGAIAGTEAALVAVSALDPKTTGQSVCWLC